MQKARKVLALVGNHAVAYAVKQAKPQVLAVFPITPQTTMLEKLAEYIAEGELKAELVKIESEHSAMATIFGAAVAGARVFTATSSQGLLYMTEMIYWVGGARVPLVAAVATRAIAAPWSILDDHHDFVSKRDAIWIQMMAENVQDAYDLTLMAFRISEYPNLLLPVMMGFDGFILTHTMERLEVLNDEEVDEFLPPRKFNLIDFEDPVSIGQVADSSEYIKYRYSAMKAMENAKSVIEEVSKEYSKLVGRNVLGLVEDFMCNDADYAIVAMGAWSGDVRESVRRLRGEGIKACLLKVKTFRPFPKELIRKYLSEKKAVLVMDRAYSYGLGGVLASEVKSAMYGLQVPVYNFVAGLGGQDVRPTVIVDMVKKLHEGTLQEEVWLV
ncbi:MAG: pyruvate ferredoxin oxidoreductase [Sulfolobales archaeon]|nr:pyruvate ferredoxin oxidoreductase [Sulfolobales archaeon]